jgi:hypothetical protein
LVATQILVIVSQPLMGTLQDTNPDFDMTLHFPTVSLLTTRTFTADQGRDTIPFCIACLLFHQVQ